MIRKKIAVANILKKTTKVFCIGRNKTGTTSIKVCLKELGYKVGNQAKGELLLEKYLARDFNSIIKFSKSADAFQDVPFSLPFTYMFLDQAYPGSKFILTIRDSPDQWYNSLVNFHSKKFGKRNGIPTSEDLKRAVYRKKGYIWRVVNGVYAAPEYDPYHKDTLIRNYEWHNYSVNQYFRYKNNLLTINISDPKAYKKMCTFLDKTPVREVFAWENKT